MKFKHIIYTGTVVATMLASLTSCNDFLDKMPDNRTQMDKESKIAGLLTTAYGDASNLLINELMSDNTDYMGPQNSLGDREGDMMFFWEDDKESGNDSPENLWISYNEGVMKANQALASIEELGGATTESLRNSKGEALLLRAYNNFLLTNEFCMAYNSQTSDKDMGVYYSKQVEKLTDKDGHQSQRGTVADDYANIAADIEAGLPLINDNYTVPKYHFNKKAALAFAVRFYLYYEKWDMAKKYADLLLGSNPGASLRNYAELQAMPLSTSEQAVKIGEAYCSAEKECNLLIQTSIGYAGYALGPWGFYKRYSHTNYLSDTECLTSDNIWGNSSNVIWKPFVINQGEVNSAPIMKIPFEIEYTDPVKGNGYPRALNVSFTMGEALLNRAEAEIMLKDYDAACTDMNTWMHNYFNTTAELTPESVQRYFNSIPYAYSDAQKMTASPKKHLHPHFAIDAEGSVQESMLQCVLDLRRIETMHQGLRWFDIKRYNIEIPRRYIGADGYPQQNLDWLAQDDPRMAVQIPMSIVSAGVQPNPRNK